MAEELSFWKRLVVQQFQKLARGRAVDVLWWEPSDEALTLYVEGRLVGGGSSRTSYTFDGAALDRLKADAARAMLEETIVPIVSRFERRVDRPGGAAA